tara:strand:- start:749 stop:850 length:102 start_codon:yes stop_codon:yes gene_type:complete
MVTLSRYLVMIMALDIGRMVEQGVSLAVVTALA